MAAVISAGLMKGAEAVHPGYGFLAENARFVRACEDSGLVFIGPSADAIDRMGDKSVARETMVAAGVPVVPGSDGPVTTEREAREFADKVGYPVIIKAAAGGGGRGMRLVQAPEQLGPQMVAAKNEAQSGFGDDTVYLEKYLLRPRHIEFQVLADTHGNAVHLFERDCSIQRRHQKLIEEAPSPAVTPDLRSRMGDAAVRGAAAIGYVGAGTVEMLLDTDGSYYFMEMNTRIQVEHPVTEMVTGVDLVKEQLLIAGGQPMSVPARRRQAPDGHAIELRINAEDPDTFAPCPGRISFLALPGGPGVRLDTHLYSGYTVPPYYDSLLAKLVVHGRDRQEAIVRARRALQMLRIDGVKTSIGLHQRILEDRDFVAGRLSTAFMDRYLARP
jgi:acetyl-CoA carboxylase biotin carboxylase subunit